nr:hypothetical protein [Tanacetum cinerariifolium]
YINTSSWDRPTISYNDDDEDCTIAFTLILLTEEPDNSLSMWDEHLDTILATESDEFIKSNVENLDFFNSNDDSTSIDDDSFSIDNIEYVEASPPDSELISSEPGHLAVRLGCAEMKVVTWDDLAFKLITLSDDQSFFDEDIPKKIYSNPLFHEEFIPMKIDQHLFNVESDLIESMLNHDSSIIISSKIDSLFDEFAGELTLLKSIPLRIDEADCHPEEETHFTKRLLYDNSSPRPSEEFVYDNSDADIESFCPSPIPVEDSDSRMEEIDLTFTPDDPMSPGIEDDDYDSERDILILKDLPGNDTLSIPEIKSFYFDIPLFSHPPAKPPDGNTGILNIKMMGDISDQKVSMHKLMITLASNQEESPNLLSHRGLKTF